MLQYAPILHICNVNECERNLDFGEKSCIFVIAYRGERWNVAFSLFFAPILGEKKSRPRKNYPRVCWNYPRESFHEVLTFYFSLYWSHFFQRSSAAESINFVKNALEKWCIFQGRIA